MAIKFLTKEYLVTQFQNFATNVSETFAKKEELNNKSKVIPNSQTTEESPTLSSINIDGDTYKIIGGGSDSVISVNDKVGVVVLEAEDVKALPENTYIPSINANVEEETENVLTTIKIDDEVYKIQGISNANDVTMTPTTIIPTTNVQSAIDYISGEDTPFVISEVGKSLVTDEEKEIWNNKPNNKEDIGLGNVDNTSDADKPVSTATQKALNGKVEKVSGKQLSTEDYTTEEKTKLSGIENGAQVNTVTSVNGQTGDVIVSGGASVASDVEYTCNMLFNQDNVQDVLDYIAGDDKIENSTINVSTYSIGGGDASLRITSEYYGIDEVLNYSVAGSDGKNYEFINVSYKGQYIGWTVTALRECYYNDSKYNVGEVIDRWMYNSSKNITVERRSKTTGNPLFVLSEEGKSLIADTEIERLSHVNNYDDSEIKSELSDIQSNVSLIGKNLENKVEKVQGKSLILDTEIERLSGLHNYDDSDIKNRMDSKADSSALLSHTQDADIHVTSADKNNWNGIYEQSTGYTDQKIADLINGAPQTLDTLKEIADAMKEHEEVVDALEEAIGTKANDTDLQGHKNNTTVHITANERTSWNNKVDKIEGKVLSTNDFTNAYKSSIDNLPSSYAPVDAEKNIVVGIQKNGNDLSVDSDRKVNITVPTKVSELTNDSGFTNNVGTITGIKMNGSSKGTAGVVDLGTIITDVSGKEDSANKVTSWSATTSDTKYPSEKLVKASLDAKGTYSKPSGGIPKTDLTSSVQTSLGSADSAVQSVKIGSTEYKSGTNVVLPAYPTTLPASNTKNTYSSTDTNPISGKGVSEAIKDKVDKEDNKSLIEDSEIERLSNVDNIADISTDYVIEDSTDGTIIDFVGYGKCEQGENPSPDNPQDIKAWNGKIKTRGKNLLNCSGLVQQTINGVTFTPRYSNNGELEYINVNGTATGDAFYSVNSLFESTSNCVLNGCPVGGGNSTYDLRFASNFRDFGAGRNVESGVSGIVAIMIRANNTLNNTKFYPMIRLAEETDSSYVPYHTSEADLGILLYGIKVASGGNYTDSDGQMWLCDKVDMQNGVVERVFDNVDLGRLSWIASSSLPNCFYANVNNGLKRTSSILCESYQYGGNEYTEKKICVSSNADISTLRLLIKNSDYADVTAFKSSLNGVNCLYQLATPTTEPLIEKQINKLKNLQTYLDKTYFEYEEIAPFTSIEYYKNNINGEVVSNISEKFPFNLGITDDGQYGYYKNGSNNVSKFYDDTEVKTTLGKKADKSEIELVSTSTTSPILDSANGNIRDFSAFGKCEQKQLSGNNLFDFSTINTANSVGLTIEKIYDSDGQFNGIKIVGTPTATSYLKFGESTAPAFEKEGIYTISGYGKLNAYFRYEDSTYSNSSNSLTSNGKKIVAFNLLFAKGSAYDEIIRPIINVGSSVLPYEPYCGGIPSPNPSYPQEIKAWNGHIKTHGKNLLNNQNIIIGDSYQNNGITYTAQKPNMVHVQGTASESSYSVSGANTESLLTTTLKAGTYTQSATSNNVNLFSRIKKNGTWETIYDMTFTLTEECPFVLRIQIPKGKTVDEDVYFMVEEGTQATDYVPYRTTEADLGISLYGIKVASGGNYTDENGQQWLCDKLDMQKGVVERVFVKYDVKGTESVYKHSTAYYPNGAYYINTPYEIKQNGQVYSNCFKMNSNITVDFTCLIGGSKTFQFAWWNTTAESIKTEFANKYANNEPVVVICELATPTTEPLTDAQINALRMLQTYSDSTYVEYGGLEPFAEIGYWLGNKNGQVLAELDSKLNKILALIHSSNLSLTSLIDNETADAQ